MECVNFIQPVADALETDFLLPGRILTAYLALFALLFGNVAGWVHVGCSHPSSGCCSHSSGCSHSSDCSGLLEDSRQLAASESAAEAHAGPCCCDNTCSIPETAEILDILGATSLEPEQPCPDPPCPDQPIGEHHSESCSVCQSFFESRESIVLTDVALLIERLAVTRDVVSVDCVFVADVHSTCQTERGPPSV